MKLGNCELRENGVLDFLLVVNGTVLYQGPSISRATNTWLRYETASAAALENVREVYPRDRAMILAARGTNVEALSDAFYWLDPRD